MTVGIVAGQVAIVQPQKAFEAQLFTQACFHVGTVKARVAARCQQAFRRGEQRPAPSDSIEPPSSTKSTAFSGAAAKQAMIGQMPVQGIVLLPGELVAPGIETEIQQPGRPSLIETVMGPWSRAQVSSAGAGQV